MNLIYSLILKILARFSWSVIAAIRSVYAIFWHFFAKLGCGVLLRSMLAKIGALVFAVIKLAVVDVWKYGLGAIAVAAKYLWALIF